MKDEKESYRFFKVDELVENHDNSHAGVKSAQMLIML